MGRKIIFSPAAIADLESVVRFIAKDNPEAAARVGHALIDRVSILEKLSLDWCGVCSSARHAQIGF